MFPADTASSLTEPPNRISQPRAPWVSSGPWAWWVLGKRGIGSTSLVAVACDAPAELAPLRGNAYPLLALLRRRLSRLKHSSITVRVASADFAISMLPEVRRPGRRAAVHSHWVFPVQTPEPDVLMARLWKAGLDATRGASSLHVIEPPPGRADSAPRADHVMAWWCATIKRTYRLSQ